MKKQPSAKDIGEKIKKIRGSLSQTEFARRVGITRSLIASYESGERVPSLESLIKLANYAGVSIDYLLGIDVPSHKLTPEEERLVSQWRKLPLEPEAPSPNVLMYLLLIIGLIIVYLNYLRV